jgi:D-arabinose 5-phosphate isomerase GutQ
MITKDDLVILLSNSGRSQEFEHARPAIIIGVKTVSVTRDRNSPLASGTDIQILFDAGPEIETGACPYGQYHRGSRVRRRARHRCVQEKGFRKQILP